MGGQQPSILTLAMSAMVMMVSIINQGIASGGGNEAYQYGMSILGLLSSYISLLVVSADYELVWSTGMPCCCFVSWYIW